MHICRVFFPKYNYGIVTIIIFAYINIILYRDIPLKRTYNETEDISNNLSVRRNFLMDAL